MFAALFALSLATAPADSTLYNTVLIQAAPGRLLETVEYVQSTLSLYDATGEPRPVLMRHAQGDHWDLMLLVPMGSSLGDYFAPARVAARERAGLGRAYEQRLRELSQWREETVVSGPALAVLRSQVATNGYFHAEMFVARAGQQDALRREREMENAMLAATDQPTNLIFSRVFGGPWDSFTLGFYRDLKHYAEGSRGTPADDDAAARKAGFASRAHVAQTLRELINSHHDTIGSVVR
jgi:hypothetical protein